MTGPASASPTRRRWWPLLLVLGVVILLCVIAGRRVLGGAQAYVFGYPLVITDVTRAASAQSLGAANELLRVRRFPDANFRAVVKPNVDTLYTTAFIDMAAGPWVFEMPPNAQRYEVMPFMDAWTNVFAAPGTRVTGTGGGRFLLTGPGWSGQTPAGLTRLAAPTRIVWLIGRTQTNGPADFPLVHALQDGLRLTRLQDWLAGRETAASPWAPAAIPPAPPVQALQAMDMQQFSARLAQLMQDNPPTAADAPMVERLAGLGIVAGQPVSWNAVDRWLMDQGRRLADWMVARQLRNLRAQATGWSMPPANLGAYGTDYSTRMGVAQVGLGANLPADAAYPGTRTDSRGEALDGRHRYRIHFPAGQPPPVKAFWSVTAYGEDDFLIANPLGRYALSSREPLVTNADGSLDLLIQASPVPQGLQSNWLPVRADAPFVLTARLYWPDARALDGRWVMPAVERVD